MELEGYQFERLLGEGQATTWLARRESDGAPVVVKTLHLERVDDWKGIELFEREAQTLRQLDHPAIPKFVDFRETDQDGAKWHIVQSYVEGETADVWGQHGVTEQSLRQFAISVLETIDYLQKFSPPLLHRDIKPQNILVTQDQVHIVDFGSVRHVIPSRTGGSTVAGTSGYMAPEQLMGRADQSSDLFGLGTTLVRLVTGLEPDDLPTRRMKLDWRGSKKISLSDSFETFIDRLIEPHPENRFPNARSAITGMDTHAPPTELVPTHRGKLVIVETERGIKAKSGFSVYWGPPIILAAAIIMGLIATPLFAVVSLVVLIPVWASIIAKRTRVEFVVHDDQVEAIVGEAFKHTRMLRPVDIMQTVDKNRRRSRLHIADVELTGPLPYRERILILNRLKEWAEPRLRSEHIPAERKWLKRSDDDGL